MKNLNQHKALFAILAMLLYLVPNMVQDVHRVWGHHEHHTIHTYLPDPQLGHSNAKCPVCVFEFNIVDDIHTTVYIPLFSTQALFFTEKQEDQFQTNAFHYYNLRAPPQS